MIPSPGSKTLLCLMLCLTRWQLIHHILVPIIMPQSLSKLLAKQIVMGALCRRSCVYALSFLLV